MSKPEANKAEVINSEDLISKSFKSLYIGFEERAAEYDRRGEFVQENYEELKHLKLFSAAIPAELGGGNLPYSKLAYLVKDMAKSCGSTALSYVMHSHPVLLNVYKYIHQADEKAKATLLKITTNDLVIAGTGANDWLESNGTAEPCEGGYRVNAHKRFVSGGPGAQVFVTSAIEETEDGQMVVHFSIPFSTEGIEIQNNWDTLGMRGTGSNDVVMKNVFVPEEAVVVKRRSGDWHPMWDMIIPIALPLIVTCYLGLAEKAVEIAVKQSQGKEDKSAEVGKMINELAIAQSAQSVMVRNCEDLNFKPDFSNTNIIFQNKTAATNAIHNTINMAANLVGGPGFFKGHPIERIVRDSRALHFHPLPESKQIKMAGRVALGLSPF